MHFGFNPTNIMGLVDLYRVTEDEKYLKLSEAFIAGIIYLPAMLAHPITPILIFPTMPCSFN